MSRVGRSCAGTVQLYCTLTAVVLCVPPTTRALDNGLGLTPPLGYNAYDHVGCCANETTMKEQGQALIDTGLQKLGFVYVNSDCGWMGGRHPNGTLYESPTKFPSGMKALADWLHARGLKLGLYSDRGTHDFSGAGLGMKGHEKDDANYLASVGADYLKVDDMSGTPKTAAGATADYSKIRDALNATGRAIFFSTCGHSPGGGGIGNKMPWVGPACAELANACRIASDVRQWGNGTFGTAKAINLMAEYGGNYSFAGAWPDPDLLFSYPAVGGDGELTCKGAGVLAYCTGSFCEYVLGSFAYCQHEKTLGCSGDPEPENSRAQYALWSILGAPLLLSFDVRLLQTDAHMKATYTNPEIIAINQDSLPDGRGSHGGRRVYGTDLPEASMGGGLIIWARNLQDPKQKGATALLFLNANTTVCDSRRCGVCNDACLKAAGIAPGSYIVRDVWAQQNLFDGKAIQVTGTTQLVRQQLGPISGSAYLKLTPSSSP